MTTPLDRLFQYISSAHRSQLEQLGLSAAEAHVYLAVLRHGPMVAAAIAKETGVPRTGIYPILGSLSDKGLIEGGVSQGSRFAAVTPEEALPALIVQEEKTLSERKRIANELAENLAPLAAETETVLDDTVQVVRTPQVITERYQRMQAETQRFVEAFVKAPILSFANPPQKTTRKRGVRYRGLYERAVIDDGRVVPYLREWIAGGEEARIYDGELPFKMVLCDRKMVLLTLARRGGSASAMFIRHAPFAGGMAALFDSFWQKGTPLLDEKQKAASTARKTFPKSSVQSPPIASTASSRPTTNRQGPSKTSAL